MIATMRGLLLILVALLALLGMSGCDDSAPSPEKQAAIEEALREYLFALAEAYSTLDVKVLEGHASMNEIAAVQKLLSTLAMSGNDRVDSELIGFEVEAMSIFREINATVRLVEVWDVTRYELDTGRVKGRNPSSVQNTLLQLRLVDGEWIVIGRKVMQHSLEKDVASEQTTRKGGEGD